MTSNCNSQAFIHEIAFEKNVIEVITGGSLLSLQIPGRCLAPSVITCKDTFFISSSFIERHWSSIFIGAESMPFSFEVGDVSCLWCHLGAGVSVYNSFDVWCAVEKCWPLLPIVAFSKTVLNIWRHSWHASFVASSCFKFLQWLLFCAVFCEGLLNLVWRNASSDLSSSWSVQDLYLAQ